MVDETMSVSYGETLPDGYQLINNGLDQIRYAPRDLHRDLGRICGGESRTPSLVIDALLGFQREVESGLNRINSDGQEEPTHVGSSDLRNAINALFYEEQAQVRPDKWGLKTDTEVRLLAAYVSQQMQVME